MGASLNGGGRRAGGRRHRAMSDINVTPLVDVMLVLLIIFMVTAPMITAGVPLDLPKTKAGPMKGDDKPLSISVKADGTLWLQETEIQLAEIGPRLQAILAQKPDNKVFVRADQGINYGRVAEVMGELQAAGITKIGLQSTQAPQAAPAKGSR